MSVETVDYESRYRLFDPRIFERGVPSPKELGLPYDEWRPAQWDAIIKILMSPAKVTIVEAPTGVGKSGIAVALGRLSGLSTTILTGTKQLQQQYESLGVPTAIGRNNFQCLEQNDTCEANCQCEDCPYAIQKNDAVESGVCVLNYAYWLRETMNPNHSVFRGRDLLILDEAHLTESEVIDVRGTYSVDLVSIKLADIPEDSLPATTNDIYVWQKWARKYYPYVESKLEWLKLQPFKNPKKKQQLITQLSSLKWSVGQIKDLAGEDLNNFVAFPEIGGVSWKPIWGGKIAREAFDNAHKIVLMSATILDPNMVSMLLGFDINDIDYGYGMTVDYIKLDSPFNPVLRPIHYVPAMKINYKTTNYRPLIETIKTILDQHPDQKGLIHAGSYKLAKVIMEGVNSPRLMTHGSKDRIETLDKFKSSDFPLVMVSPSMMTGVDLPYDQLRFQIIAKLPYPSRADEVVSARLDNPTLGPWWYNWITACAVEQAYGRGMRAEDDYCTTYIVDETWTWFAKMNGKMLSKWFKEAIVDD